MYLLQHTFLPEQGSHIACFMGDSGACLSQLEDLGQKRAKGSNLQSEFSEKAKGNRF